MLELLSNVESKPTTWLWQSWIPRGSLTLLMGAKGGGKSTVATSIAMFAMGALDLPGEHRQKPSDKTVLWVTAEESPATLKQRFGRLCKQVIFCTPTYFASAIQAMPEKKVGLVVIDPITAVMPGIDINSEPAVRSFLEPLSLAMYCHDAVGLLIGHFTKNSKADLLNRGIGSVAFVNVPRSVLAIERLPDGTSALQSVACNLCTKPNALRFRWGKPLAWLDENVSIPSVDSEGASQDEHLDALSLLRARCSRKWVSAKEIMQEAKGAGISPSLLRSAKRVLGVESERRLVDGVQGFWWGSNRSLK